MPIVSEPELELSMPNKKRYKSHSEGSDRHSNDPLKEVLHSLQDIGKSFHKSAKEFGTPGTSWKVPQRGGNSEILQWMESTIIQASNKEDKGLEQKKRGASKGEAPLASTSKPQAIQPPQEGKKNKKKRKKLYSPSYRIPRIQKNAMENVFNTARKLIKLKDKEQQRMRQPHFPKK
ncbi:hypothetical protein O181_061175 [Austropuccinia psidii MF-1]|uniref:Uncharacterized protein n=1 Tax=Austropuccinia psidii MF-1 TaxID=1389203 RepID=A0A9Q3EEP6_9BASI|nr:hypothetical protein [Austropuccinia psidii MF-1]